MKIRMNEKLHSRFKSVSALQQKPMSEIISQLVSGRPAVLTPDTIIGKVLNVEVPKEAVRDWRMKCRRLGISANTGIVARIAEYVKIMEG